jgi:hypothetical protein
VHPDKPFDFAEKAYWLQRDEALKAFDQWLHIAMEDGSFGKIYAAWFEWPFSDLIIKLERPRGSQTIAAVCLRMAPPRA